MVSTFGAYSVAYSGMYVSKAGLTAASNNLANVDTTGASRVRVSSADTSAVQADGTTVTSGARIASITRARDALLDAAYRTKNGDTTYWAVKSGNLEYMQEILSEFTASDGTGDDGLQQLFTGFFNSWEELAKDPGSQSNRQAVVEAATSLLSGLSTMDGQLQQLQKDCCDGASDGVDSLNDLAGQVAALNKQISEAENNGSEASYLRDQRDALVDQMSSLADVTVAESNGVYKVMVGGSTMINGSTYRTLTISGDGSADKPLQVKWKDSGSTVDIASGSIKAYLEDANQSGYADITDSGTYNYTAGAASSISNFRQALNDLVTTLADQVNSLYSSGYGLDDSTGLAFFTASDSSRPLSIANIQVNPEISADVDKLAAGASTADGDNTIAAAIYNLSGADIYQFDGAKMDLNDFYESIISWIGTSGDSAASSYDTQNTLLSQVDNQRQSVSSISLDEEMSKLIVYQNAYNASAQVLSTINGLIGDLIEDVK